MRARVKLCVGSGGRRSSRAMGQRGRPRARRPASRSRSSTRCHLHAVWGARQYIDRCAHRGSGCVVSPTSVVILSCGQCVYGEDKIRCYPHHTSGWTASCAPSKTVPGVTSAELSNNLRADCIISRDMCGRQSCAADHPNTSPRCAPGRQSQTRARCLRSCQLTHGRGPAGPMQPSAACSTPPALLWPPPQTALQQHQ